jgi:hypothetical protein
METRLIENVSLPQAVDVERQVLSSFLNGSEVFTVYGDKIKPEHFYVTAHQKIFRMMITTGTLDTVLLSVLLPDLAVDISEISGSASHVCLDTQIAILLDRFARREAITAATRATQCFYDCDKPLSETVETLKSEIVVPSRELWHPEESRALITTMLSTVPEPFEFIIPGLLPKGVCGFLYGEGGSYKSLAALWLCIQLASSYAANSKWLGKFLLSGPPVRSMFCSVEDLGIDFHHRVRPIVDRFCEMRPDVSRESIVDAIAENFHLIPRERWMKDGVEHVIDETGKPTIKIDLISQYAKNNGIGLIILDTLSRLSLA